MHYVLTPCPKLVRLGWCLRCVNYLRNIPVFAQTQPKTWWLSCGFRWLVVTCCISGESLVSGGSSKQYNKHSVGTHRFRQKLSSKLNTSIMTWCFAFLKNWSRVWNKIPRFQFIAWLFLYYTTPQVNHALKCDALIFTTWLFSCSLCVTDIH